MVIRLPLLILLLLPFLPGCRGAAAVVKELPLGTQMQSTTFGVKISPSAVDGTPLVIGSHTTIVTTPQPDNAPNLNRFEGTAPGVRVKSTVATGDVGGQIDAAGGPAALDRLVAPPRPPVPELPPRETEPLPISAPDPKKAPVSPQPPALDPLLPFPQREPLPRSSPDDLDRFDGPPFGPHVLDPPLP